MTNTLNQQYEILNMIENRELITKKQILQMFEITKENIEHAISSGDLNIVKHYAGRDYYLAKQVEMLIEALAEDNDDADSGI